MRVGRLLTGIQSIHVALCLEDGNNNLPILVSDCLKYGLTICMPKFESKSSVKIDIKKRALEHRVEINVRIDQGLQAFPVLSYGHYLKRSPTI